MVGVASHLGRQVEGDGEARLAVGREVLEAGVGLFGGPEASVLAHGPGPAAVHARVDASRVGILARISDRKSTRLNSSHANISYAVFCLKKKKKHIKTQKIKVT